VGQPAQHPCSAGNIQPDMVGLMNLFISWGMASRRSGSTGLATVKKAGLSREKSLFYGERAWNHFKG